MKIIKNFKNKKQNQQELEENIERHGELNPKLYGEDQKLKPEVLEKLNNIVEEFLKDLADDEVAINVKDYVIVGSNASYNYTDDSDIDVHVLVDTEKLVNPDNIYAKIYQTYKNLFNKKYADLNFYGIPVEIYVETEETPLVSNGIYSIKNNEWIKEPELEAIPEMSKETEKAFEKEFAKWEKRYEKLVNKLTDRLNENLNESLLLEYKAGDMLWRPSIKAVAQVKVHAVEAGTRKENFGVMGDDKLLDYYALCGPHQENLPKAAAIFEREILRRGLKYKPHNFNLQTNTATRSSAAQSSVTQMSAMDLAQLKQDIYGSDIHTTTARAKQVISILKRFNNDYQGLWTRLLRYPGVPLIIFCICVAALIDKSDLVDFLINNLVLEYPTDWPKDKIKTAINLGVADKVILDTLTEVVNNEWF